MVIIYGYGKCSTVRKAIKFLDTNEIQYEHVDNVVNKLTASQIEDLYKKSGLPLKKFFNTSGMLYRELNLKDKLGTMSEDEQVELLSSDGMLVKRPILVDSNKVLVGFKEEEYSKL